MRLMAVVVIHNEYGLSLYWFVIYMGKFKENKYGITKVPPPVI